MSEPRVGIFLNVQQPDSVTPREIVEHAVAHTALCRDLGFDRKLTFQPSRLRWCARATIETLRIVLPMAFIIATGYLMVHATIPFAEDEAWLELAGSLALAGCLYGR